MFSKLSGSYRQDAKAIKATRKDGKLPDRAGRRPAADRRAHTSSARGSTRRPSGPPTRLARTPPVATPIPTAVADALAVARRVLELSARDADLDVLAGKVAVGSHARAWRSRSAADQLRAATQAVLDRLAALQRFVATPDPLFGGDVDQLEAAVARADHPLRALAALVADARHGRCPVGRRLSTPHRSAPR